MENDNNCHARFHFSLKALINISFVQMLDPLWVLTTQTHSRAIVHYFLLNSGNESRTQSLNDFFFTIPGNTLKPPRKPPWIPFERTQSNKTRTSSNKVVNVAELSWVITRLWTERNWVWSVTKPCRVWRPLCREQYIDCHRGTKSSLCSRRSIRGFTSRRHKTQTLHRIHAGEPGSH